jgi:predicted metal-dependent enzyme (double-stranded beta helix superfamily)
MANSSLQTFCDSVRDAWGPLSSELVETSRRRLEDLLGAPQSEHWLAKLYAAAPARAELYRDPAHGFVLLAHTESGGVYRPPHDHGRSWVIYGVQRGEVEMRSYARVADASGNLQLVRRDTIIVRPGQALAYLPGDIHDTRCLTDSALLFRFTERDLKREDAEGHITRYQAPDEVWTIEP